MNKGSLPTWDVSVLLTHVCSSKQSLQLGRLYGVHSLGEPLPDHAHGVLLTEPRQHQAPFTHPWAPTFVAASRRKCLGQRCIFKLQHQVLNVETPARLPSDSSGFCHELALVSREFECVGRL